MVLPQFIGYRSPCPTLTPSIVIVEKGTAAEPTVLSVRSVGDLRIAQTKLTREETLELIAALCTSIGLPLQAA